ncbi:Scr1 family TA system antitoxin-like transcriptional regulator [Embleya sp. NBC_00896]|uniref:helix-turn-helix domain-containing protein n=1 Tax=Embleya sp. NBC_00896 TaxID=2975961 RepID=UPI0038696A68|nr:helix-turn-helix transcriptional regulator [Embleya sp. NBC_00896]
MAQRRESEPQPPSWIHAHLGREIRRLREESGLTQETLAEQVHVSYQHLSAIEAATRVPPRDLVAVVDEVLLARGTLVSLREEMVRSPLSDWLRKFLLTEAQARTICGYAVQAIPGLLQTEDYFRAQFEAFQPFASKERMEATIEARMGRKQLFYKEDPPEVWEILDEAALRRAPRNSDVMRRQFAHVIELSELPHVTIQVLPFSRGFHAMLDGPVSILTFAEGDDFVYVEAFVEGLVISDPVTVTSAKRRYDRLRAEALPPTDSIEMIRSILEST